MFKQLSKARFVFAILAIALLVTLPAQTSKADAASCAQAVADTAQAEADAQQTCSFGGSMACQYARARLAQLVATAANECS